MTNQKILTKAIEKAIENSWESIDMPGLIASFKIKRPAHIDKWPWYLVRLFDNSGMEVEVNVEHILFNHDFAKALWNTPRYATGELHFVTRDGRSEWQYHLQQMVIADNPIKYLGEHLE